MHCESGNGMLTGCGLKCRAFSREGEGQLTVVIARIRRDEENFARRRETGSEENGTENEERKEVEDMGFFKRLPNKIK